MHKKQGLDDRILNHAHFTDLRDVCESILVKVWNYEIIHTKIIYELLLVPRIEGILFLLQC